MTGIPPGPQPQTPDPTASAGPELVLHALPPVPAPQPAAVTAVPANEDPTERRSAWTAATVMLMVLASALAMLLAGRPLQEALTLAGGVTLLGGAVARWFLADAGPAPCLVVAAAVSGFAVTLTLRGYPIEDVALIAGLAAVIAAEVAARFPRSSSRKGG